REKLTGAVPPEAAQPMVELWRQWIEDKAHDQLRHLGDEIHNQAAFSRMTRNIIAALDMADELGDDPDQSDENESDEEAEPDAGERNETADGEDQESQQQASEEMQDSEGETDAAE